MRPKQKKTIDLDQAAIHDSQVHMLNTGCNFSETAREGLSTLGVIGPLSFTPWRGAGREGFLLETRDHIIAYVHNGIGYAPFRYYQKSLFMATVIMIDGIAVDNDGGSIQQ